MQNLKLVAETILNECKYATFEVTGVGVILRLKHGNVRFSSIIMFDDFDESSVNEILKRYRENIALFERRLGANDNS